MQRKSERLVDHPRQKGKFGELSVAHSVGLRFKVQVGQRGEVSLDSLVEER